jgi:hypothetical protein
MIDRYCRCILFLMCFTFILGWARRILGWAGPTCPPLCYALVPICILNTVLDSLSFGKDSVKAGKFYYLLLDKITENLLLATINMSSINIPRELLLYNRSQVLGICTNRLTHRGWPFLDPFSKDPREINP